MGEALNRSHCCDRYDILKKMCRQQLLLNESLKLELSKLSQLFQKVSHERDILLSELLENHSSCSVQSPDDIELRNEEHKRYSYQSGSHKRPPSSVDAYHGPAKCLKESLSAGNLSAAIGHSHNMADFEGHHTMDTDFDDIELPVTSRLKSPLLSPTPSTSEGSHAHIPARFSEHMHQPPASSLYTTSTTASDNHWTPTLSRSDSPPTVTTMPRATKPATLLSNSLVSTSATVLSQRPTLITNQPSSAQKHQPANFGISPSPRLAFSGAPRPRVVTNVSVIGKPISTMHHTNVITGQQQRIVIQTSMSTASTARRFPRPPVSVQTTIRNSQGEYF